MVRGISGSNVQTGSIKAEDLNLVYASAAGLTAAKIPFNATKSIEGTVSDLASQLITSTNVDSLLKDSTRPIFYGETQTAALTNCAMDTANTLLKKSLKFTLSTSATGTYIINAENVLLPSDVGIELNSAALSNYNSFDYSTSLSGEYLGTGAKLVLAYQIDTSVSNLKTTDGFVVSISNDSANASSGILYNFTDKIKAKSADEWHVITQDLTLPYTGGMTSNAYCGLTDIEAVQITCKAETGQSCVLRVGYLGIVRSNSQLSNLLFSTGNTKLISACMSTKRFTLDAGGSISRVTADYYYLPSSIQISESAASAWELRYTAKDTIDLSSINELFVAIKVPVTSFNFQNLELKLTNENATYTASSNKIAYRVTTKSDGTAPGVDGWKLFKFDLTATPQEVSGVLDFSKVKTLVIKLNQSGSTTATFNVGILYGTPKTDISVNSASGLITLPTALPTRYTTDSLVGYQVKINNPGNTACDGSSYDITANTIDTITINKKEIVNANYAIGNGNRVNATDTLTSIASTSNASIEIFKDTTVQESGRDAQHVVAVPNYLSRDLKLGLGLVDTSTSATNYVNLGSYEQAVFRLNLSVYKPKLNNELKFYIDYVDPNNNICFSVSPVYETTHYTYLIKCVGLVSAEPIYYGTISFTDVNTSLNQYGTGDITIRANQAGITIERNESVLFNIEKRFIGGSFIVNSFEVAACFNVLEISSTGAAIENSILKDSIRRLNALRILNLFPLSTSFGYSNSLSNLGSETYRWKYLYLKNIEIVDESIHDSVTNSDAGEVWLNKNGYLGGTTKFRDTYIGNGKGTAIISVDGSAATVLNQVGDNQANAYQIKQGTDSYINVDTTDSAEKVTIGNTTTNPLTEVLKLGTGTSSKLAISANVDGEITVTRSAHTITTFGDTVTPGNLKNINGGIDGQILMLFPSDITKVVTVITTGNIKIYGDLALNQLYSSLTLRYNGTNWVEISRSPITYAP